MTVKDKEEISCQPSEKKHHQKTSLPRCSEEETSQEIQAYHIEYNMGKTAVDKYAAYNSPGLF
jgi:hypothetical protein